VIGQKKVFIVPFSHLDLTFMGTHEECLSRANKVISVALELAREDPQFRYLLEYTLPVEKYLQCHPDQAGVLRELVAEGRIELCPSLSGIFQNSSEDEELVRNCSLAVNYLRNAFGIESKTMHLTDIPGSTPQYPQLLSKLGIEHAVLTRCGPRNAPLFYWQSPDGSRILTYYTSGYGWAGQMGLQVSVDEMSERGFRRVVGETWGGTSVPLLRTYGSDMHLPPQQLCQVARDWNATNEDIRITIATAEEYFASLEVPPDTPVLSGDMPSTWTYVLATHAQVSSLDSLATNLLVEAEKWATISWQMGYRPYPADQLRASWSMLLYAKDHNFSGRGAQSGQARKLQQRQQVASAAEDIIRDSLRPISEKVKVPRESIPLLVFNCLGWECEGPVDAHVTFYPGPLGHLGGADILQRDQPFLLKDASGASVPYQITVDRRHTLGEMDLTFVAEQIPAMGYRAYFIQATDYAPLLPPTVRQRDDIWFRTDPLELVVESDLFRLAVDKATGRLRVTDLTLREQILDDVSVYGVEELDVVKQSPLRGLSMDDPTIEQRVGANIDGLTVAENGQVRAIVRIQSTVMGVPVQQEVVLYRGLRRLDLTTVIDWRFDNWGRIEQRFGMNIKDPRVEYGVPFGACGFSDLLPGSGPSHRDECSENTWRSTREMNNWVDVSGDSWGVTLASSHRHFRLQGSALEKCLVRGGRMNGADDPHVRLHFTFSLIPHEGGWQEAKAYRRGWERVTPMRVYTVNDTVAPKTLPTHWSFCSMVPDNVVVTAIKKADIDDRVVVRAYEAEGRGGSMALDFFRPLASLTKTDLLENSGTQVDAQDIPFGPNEIVTLAAKISE